MQEEEKKDFNINITISDNNLTYSSDLHPHSTVFWLDAVKAMIINKAMTNE